MTSGCVRLLSNTCRQQETQAIHHSSYKIQHKLLLSSGIKTQTMRIALKDCLTPLLVVLIFSSCKNAANKVAVHIPKNASVVFAVNAKSMANKLMASNLSLDSLVSAFHDSSSADNAKGMMATWEELKNSGVDWENNVYFFVSQQGSIMEGQHSTEGVLAGMKDQKAFEALLLKHKKDLKIQKADKYSYTVSGQHIIGWNNDLVIAIATTSNNGMPGMGRMRNDSTESDSMRMDTTHKKPVETVDPVQELASLFNQKSEDAVTSIDIFNDLNKKESDIKMFTSSASLTAMPMMGFGNLADLLKNTYTAGTINFNDGEIKGDFDQYINKDVQSILEKHTAKTVSTDLLNHYPSNNINAFALFSFDPKILLDILKFTGFDKTADQWLMKNYGVQTADVANSFSGDFAVVVSDIGMKEQSIPGMPQMHMKLPSVKFLVVAKTGDKAALNKLGSALEQKKLVQKKGNDFVFDTKMHMENNQNGKMEKHDMSLGYELTLGQDYILGGMDSSVVANYPTTNSPKTFPKEVNDILKNNAAAGYVNIQPLVQMFSSMDSSNETAARAQQVFKDALFYTSNYKGNTAHSEMRLRLINEKQNSLASIYQLVLNAAQEQKKRRELYRSMPGVSDSATAPHVSH
ncbi:MAG: hypothetical protein JWN76_750 [Chitinophagaceae bacterium]|nr:hypothetical protein [Chitinophagaceae bacterium]